MLAYRLETTVSKNGSLNLEALPFATCEKVEIIILKKIEDLTNNKTTSFAKAAKKFEGCLKTAPVDLSTNPDYMQGFGE